MPTSNIAFDTGVRFIMLANAADSVSTSEASWLTALLKTDAWTRLPKHIDSEIGRRLRPVSFEALLSAIGSLGPDAERAGAIELYRSWIASQEPTSPYLFAAWFNLGVELNTMGNRLGALFAFRNALAKRPQFAPAAMSLAQMLEQDQQPDEAIAVLRQALQPDDARTALINNRGRLLEQCKRLEEAEQEFRKTLLIQPDQPDVIQHWIHVRQKMCQWPVFVEEIPGLSRDRLLDQAGPLGILALSDNIRLQCNVTKDWIDRKTTPCPQALSPSCGYRHDRLRLGYLSSDFCRHAMSYLITELFERHDRNRFEIFAYCSSPEDGSDLRARIIRSFDHFRIIKNLSDEQAARLIRDDEIDILVDLNGLTAGARPQVLRWKPAPVQATYLGFVGPVPLPELDYFFCDDFVVPPELADEYQPRPLYIAKIYQANDSKRGIGRATTRKDAGLPDNKFVFCCLSNHYKVTEDVFAAWMQILQRCDNAVLWLVGDNQWARHNILERAVRHGIEPGRIIFAARVDPDLYMARLRLADVFLDTFPYNAGTLASDAIRMGLPLVTIAGRSFASRMAARLLAAAGAYQGIATNLQAYIDLAVLLATDKSAYESYKALLREESWQQGLGDIGSFTRAYETTLLSIAKPGPGAG
ncbi:MAG: tetratricopeptide repeat protein [Rhodopila sp.]